jgi:prepilin-type N-terminal cleavage/methylation domain-containing protein
MGKRGFTFIEILVVMILIGVLAVIGIPRLRVWSRRTTSVARGCR